MTQTTELPPHTMTYRNCRGEVETRAIIPQTAWYGTTDWHPEPQWFLKAYDVDKGAERDFAIRDILAADDRRAEQMRVADWMLECFGPESARDKLERSDRFIEEGLELVQSAGYSPERAHALVDYVFGRPAGETGKEVGGVMVTLAALCNAHGLIIRDEMRREIDRITAPEIVAKIRAKQAAKPTGSALPVPAADAVHDDGQGYVDAFYEIAAMLDIAAQPRSPKEVYETQIKPRLAALIAAPAAPVTGTRERLRETLYTLRQRAADDARDGPSGAAMQARALNAYEWLGDTIVDEVFPEPAPDAVRGGRGMSACKHCNNGYLDNRFGQDADDEETYQIGVRDGRSEAIQKLDEMTGGDGEYICVLGGDPDDRHCPDEDSMAARIVDRFDALKAEIADLKARLETAAERDQTIRASVWKVFWKLTSGTEVSDNEIKELADAFDLLALRASKQEGGA